MATYQVSESYPPFEYGTAVLWRQDDEHEFVGSICGFSVIDSLSRAKLKNLPIGTVLALVECGSGKTVEVSLEKLKLEPKIADA